MIRITRFIVFLWLIEYLNWTIYVHKYPLYNTTFSISNQIIEMPVNKVHTRTSSTSSTDRLHQAWTDFRAIDPECGKTQDAACPCLWETTEICASERCGDSSTGFGGDRFTCGALKVRCLFTKVRLKWAIAFDCQHDQDINYDLHTLKLSCEPLLGSWELEIIGPPSSSVRAFFVRGSSVKASFVVSSSLMVTLELGTSEVVTGALPSVSGTLLEAPGKPNPTEAPALVCASIILWSDCPWASIRNCSSRWTCNKSHFLKSR